MPRQNIGHLRRTGDRAFWCSTAPAGTNGEAFETNEFCIVEDKLRCRSTQLAIVAGVRAGLFAARSARRLQKRLDYARPRNGPPRSSASSAYMRRLRDRVFSQIWKLVAAAPARVTTFTAIKRGWELTPEQLLEADLDKLLSGFLSDLNRRGAAQASGWLIAFLHGEYETPAGIFRLHLHGIVSGDMITVLDELRKGRKYKYRPDDSVRFRLRIARKPLTNLPHSLTYCFKSYWPWKHVVVGANGKRRTRRHKRIPEPYHTLVLLFLDRHQPSDFVVLQHVAVARNRLKLPRRWALGAEA